ncbi:MAG: succinyl-diaminopimelate desuccinylase [Rhodospirillales bacterium]|nr:succinyl-diaminopimelate desuccinylase [Rhodospirillales bacterium]MDE0381902.1 succinyl-diaminopimelate desuccinylase [Rhodospirillales bacterium]
MSEAVTGDLSSAGALAHPLALARALIRCESVTPADGGALDVLQGALETLGFTCHRLPFEEPGTAPVDNLYARRGEGRPNFCFAGHTDVVPVGDRELWTREPFAARVEEGVLYGRGASDMKGAIAAFVAAVARLDTARAGAGSISLLITGDEEGPAVNGTRKVLDWLAARGETLDVCLVGEPTNPEELGEMVKIGRRGSLNGTLRVEGRQGHVAYPMLAENPLPRLVALLNALLGLPFYEGTEHFQPSRLELTTIDVGNRATNVIPGAAAARFNVRFNDRHTGAGLERTIRACLDATGEAYELAVEVSGEAFLTPPGRLSAIIAESVAAVTGRTPILSTTGGTSDARFIKDHCPVAEFGLLSRTMHRADECVPVEAIERLADIYLGILERYFAEA